MTRIICEEEDADSSNEFILNVAVISGLSNGSTVTCFLFFRPSIRFVHDIGERDRRQTDALFPCGFE